MRRALLALSVFAAPLVLAAAPVAHAAGPALVVKYYKDHTLADGGSLDVGTSDGSFEFFLTLSSEGDSALDLGTITVPAGFSFVYDPSNTSVGAGATANLRLSCDNTASGALTIPSNDPYGAFTATLSCSTNGTGTPTVELLSDGNDPIPDGSGSVTLNAGAGAVVWIFNTGVGTANLNLFAAEVAPAGGIKVSDIYIPESRVPSGGLPSYLQFSCRNPQTNEPVTGDFVISIPVGAWEDYYTFTVHCVSTDGGSLGDVPTGSGLTMWGSAVAALLLAAGAGLWLASRRAATSA